MRFHEAVAQTLADLGIKIIFGVIGDGNLYMMDSFERRATGKYVSVANEASAVLAANGYARTSGRLGVASVTRGPGLTNVVTALVASVKDRTPLLLITGDTPVIEKDHLQDVAQREIVLSTGAGFEQVRSPESVAEDLTMAIRRAHLEQRPIVLNVPVEFQWQEVELQSVPSRMIETQAIAPDPEALDLAVGIIAGALRPVVLAGRGATSPAARAAILRLAERIGAPVATTLQGKDLFRGETFDLGVFGTFSSSLTQEVIANCDCIVAFGASLNNYTTARGSLLSKKKVVHVDMRRENISLFSAVSAGVVGDATTVADTIVEWLDGAEVPSSNFASKELAQQIVDGSNEDFVDQSTRDHVDIRTALRRIDEIFPTERSVVFDTGHFIRSSFTALHVRDPSAYVLTTSYGAIGLGMGNAIGAYFGAPERPVLLVCGDGGFMLGGMVEFNTAVRHGIDLVVIVMNDGAYGAEYIQFRGRDMDPSISTFDWPDFGPVATALGGQGFTVRSLEELDVALETIASRRGPILIDVKIGLEEENFEHGV